MDYFTGKNILLTGANGFLGKVIKNYLQQIGNNVTGISRTGKGDLTIELSKPFEFPYNFPADIIIHAAGKAHVVPKTKQEEDAFFKTNYKGTVNLCNSLLKLPMKPQSFIFISTVAVYGVEEGILVNEDHTLDGISPYAKSKIMAEEWLQNWALQNKIQLSILRLPLVAGPDAPGNLGAMIKGIKTGRYLGIAGGKARKSVVWAEDIAAFLPKVAETGGIYNLTDGYHPSFKELEIAISKALNKSNPKHIPKIVAKLIGLVGDLIGKRSPINSSKLQKMLSDLTFDDTRARQQLGWKPSLVLEKLPTVI